MAERVPLMAGNWKMNFAPQEAVGFVGEFKGLVANTPNVEILICAPFPFLHELHSLLEGSNILLGAQNIFFEEEGTFTGEVSAKMVVPYCSHVIVGHSERRAIFKESNEDVNRKVKKALEHGLTPIMCFGESLEERNAGKTNAVIEEMLSQGLAGLDAEQVSKAVLAYEPVWAISKGKTDIAKSQAATPETAQETHAFVRAFVAKKFGQAVASGIRILYGGSMKPANVKELMAQKDIDGGLIGGASLDPKSFAETVNFGGD